MRAHGVRLLVTQAEERDCENKLVVLLDYDKFDLIKLLLKHRWKVAACTQLAQAQNDAAKEALLRTLALVTKAGAPSVHSAAARRTRLVLGRTWAPLHAWCSDGPAWCWSGSSASCWAPLHAASRGEPGPAQIAV